MRCGRFADAQPALLCEPSDFRPPYGVHDLAMGASVPLASPPGALNCLTGRAS